MIIEIWTNVYQKYGKKITQTVESFTDKSDAINDIMTDERGNYAVKSDYLHTIVSEYDLKSSDHCFVSNKIDLSIDAAKTADRLNTEYAEYLRHHSEDGTCKN